MWFGWNQYKFIMVAIKIGGFEEEKTASYMFAAMAAEPYSSDRKWCLRWFSQVLGGSLYKKV